MSEKHTPPEPGQLILPDGSVVNLNYGTWNPVKYGYTPSPLTDAAPDLLAACEFAIQWLGGDDAKLLQVAIAKAKGEKP